MGTWIGENQPVEQTGVMPHASHAPPLQKIDALQGDQAPQVAIPKPERPKLKLLFTTVVLLEDELLDDELLEELLPVLPLVPAGSLAGVLGAVCPGFGAGPAPGFPLAPCPS
jgi:hypothetical protein